MAILVIGSTGKVGSEVLRSLVARGAEVQALTRDPENAHFPTAVKPVKGDVLDIGTMRAVLAGVTTLFLINPVAKDELTQALVTLSLAVDAGVKRVVYVSMFNADVFADTPHSAAKYSSELMIKRSGIVATILRPTYFMQNDYIQKDALMDRGLYAMPIGSIGVSMVDIRDVAEVAALELIRLETANEPASTKTIELVGPDIVTGEAGATLWSRVLGREIVYGGDQLDVLEKRIASSDEGWLAYDQVLMFRDIHRNGMIPAERSLENLVELLGRPLRTYRSFVEETAEHWQHG